MIVPRRLAYAPFSKIGRADPLQNTNDSGDESEEDKDLAATSNAKERRTLKRKGGVEEDAVSKKVKVANEIKTDLQEKDEQANDESSKASKLNIGSIIGKKRRKGKGN